MSTTRITIQCQAPPPGMIRADLPTLFAAIPLTVETAYLTGGGTYTVRIPSPGTGTFKAIDRADEPSTLAALALVSGCSASAVRTAYAASGQSKKDRMRATKAVVRLLALATAVREKALKGDFRGHSGA